MQKKIEKTSIEFDIFQDFWNLHQDYYEPQSIQEWEIALSKADLLCEKYKHTEFKQFIRDLCMAHMNECERRYKG